MSATSDSEPAPKVLNARKICINLQSDDKRVRKQALLDFQQFLSDPSEEFSFEDLRGIFNETHMYTVNALRDKSEPVREQAIKFMQFYIVEKMPVSDYYLTYVFPVIVERIGTVELVEESEEIRLYLIQFVQAVINRYSNTKELKPFLNDVINILCETVKDKYPAIKETSCKCIIDLALALPKDFHLQSESLTKPVLSAFSHQRYKVRLEAVKCMGDILMHSSYRALEEAITPLAERLFDQIPLVRRTVIQVAARLLLEYRDRYSFFHKLLPLILTGLNDEVPETREEAHRLWKQVGLQFQNENENDLKDQLDYLTEPPKHYPPHLERPNLGCRILVQRNIGKLAPALDRELSSWQADVRVRCSQLLCAIALHAEEYFTHHLQDLLPAMFATARDDDTRVVVNIVEASKLLGWFVPVETWKKIMLPAIEDGVHYGHLIVLAGLIQGAPQECVSGSLEEIAKLLAEPFLCQNRKARYQKELVKNVLAIQEKYDTGLNDETGKYLFTTLITVISLRHVDNPDINVSLLDGLTKTLQLETTQNLWRKYTKDLLLDLNKDPKAWLAVTAERCILETILLESGEAFGEDLDVIGDILVKTLDTEADAEARLQTFVALSTALENKDKIFKNAKNLNGFLEKLVSEIIIPTLVWHAGRTAEAMRTMAASCLRSALLPAAQVNIFSSGDVLRPLIDKLTPLLLSLMEDASFRSRQLAIENIILLKETAHRNNNWEVDDLLKIYPEALKRLDDPTDKVRITAVKNLARFFQEVPGEFLKPSFKPHHELIIDTLLTHFDDDDSNFQGLVLDVLKELCKINKKEAEDKVNKLKPLLRNKTGCDELLDYLKQLDLND